MVQPYFLDASLVLPSFSSETLAVPMVFVIFHKPLGRLCFFALSV